MLKIEDCLDADGGVEMPPGTTLISLIERNIANVSNALRTKILGWPTKMVGRILGIREKTQLFAVLTNSARELCMELAAVGSQPLPDAEEAD